MPSNPVNHLGVPISSFIKYMTSTAMIIPASIPQKSVAMKLSIPIGVFPVYKSP